MAELTKEHFDKQLSRLVSKDYLEEQFEKQAVFINSAFQEQKDHFDKRLDILTGVSIDLAELEKF